MHLGIILTTNIFLFCIVLSANAAINITQMADDNWLLVKSKNFEIITDLNEDKAHHLVDDLESYRYFSIDMMGLGSVDGDKPLKILAVSNNYNFRKLGFTESIAGAFSLGEFGFYAIANVTEYNTNSNNSSFGRQVLLHEYNHFLVHFNGHVMSYPMWYDEGMAEYWGTFKYDGTKLR